MKTQISTKRVSAGVSTLLVSAVVSAFASTLVVGTPGFATPVQSTTTQISSALLAAARGVGNETQAEISRAHEQINQIIEREQGLPRRESTSRTDRSPRDLLLHEPIVSVGPLGGGFNKTYLVKFENGKRAVFKPFFGQENLKKKNRIWKNLIAYNREATAGRIIEDFLGNAEARAQGQSVLVTPETIEVGLYVNGQTLGYGSMQLFVDDAKPLDKLEQKAPGTIATLRTLEIWKKMEVRIRVIDFILGNPDRLENPGLEIPHFEVANFGNLLVKGDATNPDGIKIALIDHSWGRPGPAQFDARFLPDAHEIPEDLKESIRRFDFERFRKTYADQLPPEGIEDLVQRVQVVQKRL